MRKQLKLILVVLLFALLFIYEVLQRCLAKDRAARFNSAAELQRQLIPALKDCSVACPSGSRRARC